MKRFALLVLVFVLGALPLFSYSPIVEPDPAFLPALLDSTVHYRWDSDSGDFIVEDRRAYTYDDNGNQTEEIVYQRNSDSNDWVISWRAVNSIK